MIGDSKRGKRRSKAVLDKDADPMGQVIAVGEAQPRYGDAAMATTVIWQAAGDGDMLGLIEAKGARTLASGP